MFSGSGVLVVLWVDVHGHIGDIPRAPHEHAAHGFADLVALGDAHPGIAEDEMHVHQHLAGHAPGAQQVQILDTIHRLYGVADIVQLFRIETRVDEFADTALGHIETDLADHASHQQRGDRVQIGESQQRAADADDDHHRRDGIAAGMPGIGAQKLGIQAPRVAHAVVVDRLLADHGNRRQRHGPGLGHHRRLRCEQGVHAVVGDTDTDQYQRRAQTNRGGGLDARVAVRVILVGFRMGVLGGVQNQHIRCQIRK